MRATQDIHIQTAASIHAVALMDHVRFLASPRLRGRMPGDVGYSRACRYVEKWFQNLGLEPLSDAGSYRQAFTLETNRIVSARLEWTNIWNESSRLELGSDFICRGLSGGGRLDAELVFAGYGIRNDEIDELSGLDLENKIVLAFKYPPPGQTDAGNFLPRARAQVFKSLGARALVLVPNPNLEKPDRLSASLMESTPYIEGFPMLVLSDAVARRIMTINGDTLSARQYRIDMLRQPASCPIQGRMKIRVVTDWDSTGKCWNVAGLLRGSDPLLSSEAIVVGAHLDHVGIQGETVIFHGAQDNASGVAAMMEIARSMTQHERPLRSIVFIAFGAEEAGIIGSRFYAAQPLWPLDRTRAMFNLDCMGAGNGLDTRGRKDHPQLFETFDAFNRDRFSIEDTRTEHPAGGADAEVFQLAGIPNMFIVSRLPYQHLHMASDTPETLNPDLFESISRLTCATVSALSKNNSLPAGR